MAFGYWLSVLRPEQRIRAVDALVQLAKTGDTLATQVGLDLIVMWVQVEPEAINEALASRALIFASQNLGVGSSHDLYNWHSVLQILSPSYPREVAELIVNHLTDPKNATGWADGESVGILTRAAAANAEVVMQAIGEAILDRKRRQIFGIAVFRGLFEKIGPECVAAWLNKNGRENLRWLARHFPSPYPNKAGQPTIPPLTAWLFRDYENDDEAFEWFLIGRDTGEFFTRDDNQNRKRKEMELFLNHEMRRAREWAKYEIAKATREAQYFRDMDEEDERR